MKGQRSSKASKDDRTSTPPTAAVQPKDSTSEVAPTQDSSGTEPAQRKAIWKRTIESVVDTSMRGTTAAKSLSSAVANAGISGTERTLQIGNQAISVAGKSVAGMCELTVDAYSGSQLESAINYVDGALEQGGVKKAVTSSTGAIVDKIDQVTGKQLLALVEARLQRQDNYNDLLATRLAEALRRIATLENEVAELKLQREPLG